MLLNVQLWPREGKMLLTLTLHCKDHMGPLSLDLEQCMKQTALPAESWSQLAQDWAEPLGNPAA